MAPLFVSPPAPNQNRAEPRYDLRVAVAVDPPDVRLGLLRDRHPLAGDGVAVLQPGGGDGPDRHAQPVGDHAGEVFRPDAGLLHPQVQVVAGAARLVRRHLLDLEVLGADLDPPADAGDVGGE